MRATSPFWGARCQGTSRKKQLVFDADVFVGRKSKPKDAPPLTFLPSRYVLVGVYFSSLVVIAKVAYGKKARAIEVHGEVKAHFSGSYGALALFLTTFSTIYSGLLAGIQDVLSPCTIFHSMRLWVQEMYTMKIIVKTTSNCLTRKQTILIRHLSLPFLRFIDLGRPPKRCARGYTVIGIPEEAYLRGFVAIRWIGATLMIVAGEGAAR